jgi:hypothetical protein
VRKHVTAKPIPKSTNFSSVVATTAASWVRSEWGSNSRGARINLGSRVLNPDLLGPELGPEVAALWGKCRLPDRMDAIIAQEDVDGLRVAAGDNRKAAHAVAVTLAPETARPIRDGARRILRAIREDEQTGDLPPGSKKDRVRAGRL